MDIKEIVFKFEGKSDLFSFADKVNLVENEKLIKILGRENIKNNNSSLIIKSIDLPVYDVIQFKVNVSETGTFLFNFDKTKIDEQIRTEILSKIKELKDNITPTKETQIVKIQKLFNLIKDFEPIYAAYSPLGECSFTFDEIKVGLENSDFSFPVLILIKSNVQKENTLLPFKMFTGEYLFTGIFSMLFAFALYTGIFEILNKQSISAFLIILAVVFLVVTFFATYSAIYKKQTEQHKGLKYFILIYIVIGSIIGLVISFVTCKYALKVEVENFNHTLVNAISIPLSIVLSSASVFSARAINFIIKKISKK